MTSPVTRFPALYCDMHTSGDADLRARVIANIYERFSFVRPLTAAEASAIAYVGYVVTLTNSLRTHEPSKTTTVRAIPRSFAPVGPRAYPPLKGSGF